MWTGIQYFGIVFHEWDNETIRFSFRVKKAKMESDRISNDGDYWLVCDNCLSPVSEPFQINNIHRDISDEEQYIGIFSYCLIVILPLFPFLHHFIHFH